MKKLIAVLVLGIGLLWSKSTLSAQEIYFCEGVTDQGNPITASNLFTISESGSYLYVLVKLPYEVLCRSVRFEINKNGYYENTIYVDTETNWVWFWKKVTFYQAGNYEFKLYDCFDLMLASASVRIQVGSDYTS